MVLQPSIFDNPRQQWNKLSKTKRTNVVCIDMCVCVCVSWGLGLSLRILGAVEEFIRNSPTQNTSLLGGMHCSLDLNVLILAVSRFKNLQKYCDNHLLISRRSRISIPD